jgi:hypothetical protein
MKGVPKHDGSGMGMRLNLGRGGCKVTKQKPKGRQGLAATKRLGRNYKTGGFNRIVQDCMRRGGSAEKCKKIAASVYWKKVREYMGRKG